ncbi:hypothetical protein EPA93_11150 [Ktedonosporobacter rubrisoli]|uniref:Uncharacterized protein n=1 Tax=Ktedonosporobacter rubrisoli TaxID=2509675 RepID=A0A4P6JN99_KTERU|nr:hypothetical protein [Ktedonosporobacter rubrisoli]QBD76532.1 hypothetical protein EPA93_11150 [Ktedonosporobacter rubrisoli]
MLRESRNSFPTTFRLPPQIAIIPVIILAILLAACGGGNASTPTDNGPTSNATTDTSTSQPISAQSASNQPTTTSGGQSCDTIIDVNSLSKIMGESMQPAKSMPPLPTIPGVQSTQVCFYTAETAMTDTVGIGLFTGPQTELSTIANGQAISGVGDSAIEMSKGDIMVQKGNNYIYVAVSTQNKGTDTAIQIAQEVLKHI